MKLHNNYAFTLLELLIALAISAFIITGVYVLLNSIITSNNALSNKYFESQFYNKLSSLLNSDYRQSIQNNLRVEDYKDNKKIEFLTTNSIFFNRALPVNVSYYIDENYLIREESIPSMDFDFKLRLIDNVSSLKILFYDSFEKKFKENNPSGNVYMFKFLIKWNENNYEFVVGKFIKK